MASGSKRKLPDLVHPDVLHKRQNTKSGLSPRSSPEYDSPPPAVVPSTKAVPTAGTTLPPATTQVPQTAKVGRGPVMIALATVLGELRDSLTKLPPLQMAVGRLLKCAVYSETEPQNREEFDELAFDLANLAILLQHLVVQLKPHDGPHSITNIARAIDKQTKLAKAQQEWSPTDRLATAKNDGEEELKCYRMTKALFQQLQTDMLSSLQDDSKERDMDVIIKHLSPVYDAYHNAALLTSATKRARCTQGTRVNILETARDWARGGNAAEIFWLNGMAGTGKTTIAYTLCEMLLKDKLLGASFFCSRNSPDCQDVNRIVPTIAYQLGQYSRLYRQELCKAFKTYSDISKRDIGAQFRYLILEPYENIDQTTLEDIIVVVDALDECDDEAGTKILLEMLIQHAAKLPIKFFVASRPEPTVSDIMEARGGVSRSIFWLHDIEESLMQADIKLYLTEALASIDISPSEIDELATRAGNLFIFATTAVHYILPSKGAVNRRQRLRTVLELQPSRKHRSNEDIDNMYAAILAETLNKNIYEEDEITARQRVLKTVIRAREPLTIPTLAEILHMSDEDVMVAIQPLQSLLYVSTIARAVSALHGSFPDFLLAKERAGPFYCDATLQSSYLAECCFELMGRSLKFNICGLESSYVLDKDVPNLQCRVDKVISSGLFYSCRYWGDHLIRSPSSAGLLSLLRIFLRKHLLSWMEVLNLKGWIGHGEVVLTQALAWLQLDNERNELRDLIYDARNFLTVFASNPISLSTPHIYLSMLPFTSKENRVRMTYWERTRGLVQIEGVATEGRRTSALATWFVGGIVHNIAQSNDGRRIASGSSKNEVSVWDVSRGVRALGPLEGHVQPVLSVAFSPNSSRIASGSEDHTIRVWDAHDGNLAVGPLCGHILGVTSVAFSPDGTRLASGSNDCTVRIWDTLTGAAIYSTHEGHQAPVWSVAFSPDGQHLASGSDDRTIRVWNWRTGVTAPRPMEGHSGPVYSVAYSPDGLRLASGSNDRMVRVWDISSGTLLADPFVGHTGNVLSVSFSPNSTQIVSGSDDDTIRVWEVDSGNLLARLFDRCTFTIGAALFTPDGSRILSGSWDGAIRVWDTRQGTVAPTESAGYYDGIWSVAISPDGTRAASGSCDCMICVWDTHSGSVLAGPFKGHTQGVSSLAFSPDGARIVSGSYDCTLCTWDVSAGTLLAGPLEGHNREVHSVAFSPDGNQIASGSGDCTIRLWDSHTGQSVAQPFSGHTGPVRSIAYSPNCTGIVSGSDDGTVRMWDTNDGTTLWTSDAHTGNVKCLAFSPDGTRVVSGSVDQTVLVLDAGDGAVLHVPFTGHSERVSSIAFSPDGTRVVSGSADQTVRVWDVESGAEVVGPLKGHTHQIHLVAFSPDGTRIISGSYDGTVRFWDVAAATRPDATLFDGWSIDNDGWLIDSEMQRLLWVPSELRAGFWFPTLSNHLAIGTRSTTRIDSTTLLGERWYECYNGSL